MGMGIPCLTTTNIAPYNVKHYIWLQINLVIYYFKFAREVIYPQHLGGINYNLWQYF